MLRRSSFVAVVAIFAAAVAEPPPQAPAGPPSVPSIQRLARSIDSTPSVTLVLQGSQDTVAIALEAAFTASPVREASPLELTPSTPVTVAARTLVTGQRARPPGTTDASRMARVASPSLRL